MRRTPPNSVLGRAACVLAVAGLAVSTIQAQQLATAIPTSLSTARAMHVANRLTFGQTEALVNQLTGPIANYYAYLNAQLNPNLALDNPDVGSLLSQLNNGSGPPPFTTFAMGMGYRYRDIQNGVYAYSAVSDFQLVARMGHFWERHFNTYANRVRGVVRGPYANNDLLEAESLTCRIEWEDYEFYRQNSLGQFRDLIGYTFYSPAMLIYLDTVLNECGAGSSGIPNENMSRELMELHGIGTNFEPTGELNYGINEIQAVARAMSGWGLRGNGYGIAYLRASFNVLEHCGTATTIFGTSGLPAYTLTTGINAVDDLLDYLAGTEACADFICRKLMLDFMGDGSDDLYPNVLTQMKAAWGPAGDIRAVLNVMLSSGEFLGQTKRWCRAKTPMETAISHQRTWGGSYRDTPGSASPNLDRLNYVRVQGQNIGQSLFLFVSPDGFALESNEQPGSGIMLKSLNLFSESYYTNEPYAGNNVRFDFPAFVMNSLPAAKWGDPRAVATLFLQRAYGAGWNLDNLTAVGFALATDVTGALAPLDPMAPDYGKRLGQGVVATTSTPRGLLR
ncbi:MAG: DUF1800 domain-containing protein [bacterium]|nr:DUF1800 domain-containing protein [bacterium]